MAIETFVNAWIDANLLLAVLVAVWLPVRTLLAAGRLGQAVIGQARALEWIFLAVLLVPFLARLISGWGLDHVNLTDVLVAQYLKGNVEMSAVRFESLLGLREDLVGVFLLQNALWAQAALAVLTFGACVSVLHLGVSLLQLRGIVRRATCWRRFGRLYLLVSDDVSVPFSTCGLFRRYVVLPSNVLGNGRDLHFALAHEFQHLRQSDLAYTFVTAFLRPFFFWNPAFHQCCSALEEARELACDQALVLRRSADLGGYCRSLIRASARARETCALVVPAAATVGFVRSGQSGALDSRLGRRILSLTGNTPSAVGQRAWMGFGLLFCALLLANAVLLRSPSKWTHERIMLSTIVNLERLDERNALRQQVRTAVLAAPPR